nr:hypothetical protein GCM10020093_000530 [Planobispora longispora]
MNEELQSTNDELQQINEVLNTRSAELDRANDFISSVVRSLGDAVIVVDSGLRVLVWSPGAEDLWGLRPDETVGRQLTALDIGLPVEELLPRLRPLVETGPDAGAGRMDGAVVNAVNRRGRTTRLDVAFSRLRAENSPLHGVIMVMNQLPQE